MSSKKCASSTKDLSADLPPPLTTTRSSPWNVPSAPKHRRDFLDEEDFPALGSSSNSSDTSNTNQTSPGKEDSRIATLIRDRPVARIGTEDPDECMMSGGLSEEDDRCELGRGCAFAKASEDQAVEEHAEAGEIETKGRHSESEDNDEYSDDSSRGAYGSDDYDEGAQYGTGTQWGWL